MKLEIVDWLESLVEYLWKHKKQFLANAEINGCIDFDYPNYAGLPKEIYNKLDSEHVDLIQEHLFDMLCELLQAKALELLKSLKRSQSSFRAFLYF